ncbi:MAG TPA: HAD-IA family hydrolase [Acidimicrobiia bacterium]|nr:HAD-IA family hydrolase [Acidimicrobiia bacterium]
MSGLEAVTFDFWNTLMWEPEGALVAARLPALCEVLAGSGIDATVGQVTACHEVAFQRYQTAWRANEQYRVPDAVDTMVAELGVAADEELRNRLEEAFNHGGRSADIRLTPGIEQCLASLQRAGIRLSIICDIGLTPSPVVRWHLERHGLLKFFDGWVFSDEVGAYKPDARVFELALDQLGVDARRAAHVGDRRRTDVAGALGAGLAAIRYRGVYDDVDAAEPEASHVIDHHGDLPAIAIGQP